MSFAPAPARHAVPQLVRTLDLAAKAALVLLLALALASPDLGNMVDKAAGLRAVAYPLLAFTIPAVWWMFWRDRVSFPWVADLMVTITCFTDVLGNRMDLYDRVVWFDDWMHFMNTGLLTAAFVLLTLELSATFGATLERALAFGVPAAVFWEVAEYYAFISRSSERLSAYGDTLADLVLGSLGAVVAAVAVHRRRSRGGPPPTEPRLEVSRPVPATDIGGI